MKANRSLLRSGVLFGCAVALAAGCARERPVSMAPPVQAPPPAAPGGASQVYNWRDVPRGEQIPITRAVFDQGGYQLYARTGETVVVPFENQNMYVMKFGRTGGEMYFVNEGEAPVLYLREGMGLENASAQGARWYPFSQGHHYDRPVYVGIAPSWPEFMAMGWYPGMLYYGGYWGYRPWIPGFAYAPMIGLNFNIGGRSYNGWDNYRSYYRSAPANRYAVRNVYNYSSVGRRSAASSSFGRSAAGASSFGRSAGRSAGSFGSGLSSAARPSSSFGGSSSGFGSAGRRAGGSFGGGVSGFSSSNRTSGGSFGGGSFNRPSSSSFGGGASRPSSSSFGSSRPSGGFGGFFGRSSGSSFGGGSFGGGRRSGGFGGFGGRRR